MVIDTEIKKTIDFGTMGSLLDSINKHVEKQEKKKKKETQKDEEFKEKERLSKIINLNSFNSGNALDSLFQHVNNSIALKNKK